MRSMPLMVASVTDLQAIHVAELQDGVWCYVQTGVPLVGNSFYYLNKFSGAVLDPVFFTTVPPFGGSPNAGAPAACWIQCQCAPSHAPLANPTNPIAVNAG